MLEDTFAHPSVSFQEDPRMINDTEYYCKEGYKYTNCELQ